MTHAPPRYPIDVIRTRLLPGSAARCGGRIIGEHDGRALVGDVSGSVWVHCKPVPILGAWVIAEGTWDGREVRDGQCLVVSSPLGAFPKPGGDYAWGAADGGRRIAMLQGRARVLRAIREFFDLRAFIEVETPLAVPSPGLDLHLDAVAVPDAGQEPRWLITSPEYQMKRVLAMGLPRLYQLCRCFRRGELGARHHPEFTMLEWYRAFGSSKDVMRDTEELVQHIARSLGQGSTEVPGLDGRAVDVAGPWPTLTVAEAFAQHAGVALSDVLPDEERFFRILVDAIEPKLGDGKPTFLVGWPASMASLARLDPEDPTIADRFEAYVSGVELCNGFGELVDAAEQRRRLLRDQRERERLGKPVYPIDERFLGALEEAIPPCGGNALGVDRLVMLVLGAASIDDVVAIPPSRL